MYWNIPGMMFIWKAPPVYAIDLSARAAAQMVAVYGWMLIPCVLSASFMHPAKHMARM